MNPDVMQTELETAAAAINVCQAQLPPPVTSKRPPPRPPTQPTIDVELMRQQLQIAEDAVITCQAELIAPVEPPPIIEPPPVIEPPIAPPDGAVHPVRPGDDVQGIINAAAAGDVLEFSPGQRYVVGSLAVAGKALTLRAQGALPDRRVTPTDSLPVLASGQPGPTIDGTNATGLTIQGLSFEARADGMGDVLVFEEANRITLDRIVILGGTNGQKRGIRGNGQNITLTRSYIANCWRDGQDSQAFCAWNGAGPFTFRDCYFEAASENVMFGGADSVDEAHMPSNILIENCDFSKREAWRPGGAYAYAVKNLFELKMARNVVVRNCRFSKNWTDAQAGWAIVLKSANQDGGNPWAITENVLFDHCTLTESQHAVNIQGKGTENAGQHTTGLTFWNCRFATSEAGIQIGGDAGVVAFEHCTFENGTTFLSLYGDDYAGQKAVGQLIVAYTAANHNEYGVKGGGTASGTPSLDRYVTELHWSEVLLAGCAGYPYPPTTYNRAADVPAGVEIGAP